MFPVPAMGVRTSAARANTVLTTMACTRPDVIMIQRLFQQPWKTHPVPRILTWPGFSWIHVPPSHPLPREWW